MKSFLRRYSSRYYLPKVAVAGLDQSSTSQLTLHQNVNVGHGRTLSSTLSPTQSIMLGHGRNPQQTLVFTQQASAEVIRACSSVLVFTQTVNLGFSKAINHTLNLSQFATYIGDNLHAVSDTFNPTQAAIWVTVEQLNRASRSLKLRRSA